MCKPFIRNHDYNFINKQADYVLHALRTVGDPKIVASVRSEAQAKVAELFAEITDERSTMLASIADLQSTEDFQKYMQLLEPYRDEFPSLAAKDILKLFPKVKKLKLPDLAHLDYRKLSYLSWADIATNRMYIVYPSGDGQFIGLEGRYTASSKKSYCFACNRLEEVVLFSANFKKRPVHASPDYYKTIGNYICANGHTCNKNITSVASLERFIEAVVG
ncbi:treble-clef zinc-finger protein [Paenibacillus taihuensis]|uniref:Treble-clef zinc-finger protein n=1 Tax=Paenibacillus taihuensis TaxID=1156355 RepID=A0A3D9SFX6_9BACL|nr:FusB/FusC family EF-G-binding protein [Paenibacillus taihuensis]REE94567.1 treble-clef zinc-finger protein [Paenibacillus taihuensis]